MDWDPESHEPNGGGFSAYPIQVGNANALKSEIERRRTTNATQAGDIDWFVFKTIAGRGYRIELSELDPLLESRSGNAGVSGLGSYPGLALSVHDSSLTLLDRQRPINEEGIHNRIEVRGNGKPVLVAVEAFSDEVYGCYKLAVAEID